MKILIQSESAGLFLGASGEWVEKKKKLMEFNGAVAALRFCLGRNLKDVRLLFAFRKPALNFFVSPFNQGQAAEFASRPDFRNSVLKVARNLAIQQENLQLRRDLETILAEREARKRKAVINSHLFSQVRKRRAA